MSDPHRSHLSRRWLGASWSLGLALLVTAVVALMAVGDRGTAVLTAKDDVLIGSNVSVTPDDDWVIGSQGNNWIRLHNTDSTAELEIIVKKSSGTDADAVLHSDINNLSNISSTGLVNVSDLSESSSRNVQGKTFNDDAYINYTAQGSSGLGLIGVTGWFMELLSPSTHQSAFIVYTQNPDAPAGANDDAMGMVDSMV